MKRPTLFPYCKLRRAADGTMRPRFEPGPRERALGFVAEDLRHPASGAWFSLDEVAAFAAAKKTEILATRTGKRPIAAATSPAPAARTIGALLDAYLASADFKRLRDRTQLDYEKKARAIRFRPRLKVRVADMPGASRRAREEAFAVRREPLVPEIFAMAPAAAVTPANVKAFFEYLVRARGLAMARGAVAVLSAAFKWARLAQSWELKVNPCHDLDLPAPRTNVVIYEPTEIVAMRLMGDATGDEEIVDAMILGLLTDQRPTDILAFTGGMIVQEARSEATGIATSGTVRLIQSKTGRRLELPALSALVARLQLMQVRRQTFGWTCPELVVDRRIAQGFAEREFNTRWRALIARTAAGNNTLGLAPCPTIAGKKFKHLRKTTFTWLHRAGNDLLSIGSVSGHTIASLPQMAKHYLELDRATAAVAMGKLDLWMEAKGVKL